MKIAFNRVGNCLRAYSDKATFSVLPIEQLPAFIEGTHATYDVPVVTISATERKKLLAGREGDVLQSHFEAMSVQFGVPVETLGENAQTLLQR